MNTTNGVRPIVAIFWGFRALVSFICFSPGFAFAYGVYEDQIFGAANSDAPQLFSQAFPTPAPFDVDNGLQAIEGYLDPDEGDLADMYCIFIGGATEPVDLDIGKPMMRYTPQEFSVTTVTPVADGHTPRIPDPQVFLFDRIGHPLVGNDDIDDINQNSLIPAGTITQSGVYILAITGAGFDPTDAAMNALFTNNSTGLTTPTNVNAVQAGWNGTHNQDGWYRLKFGGEVRFGAEHWVPVPEPTTFALLLLGPVPLTRWRKCR